MTEDDRTQQIRERLALLAQSLDGIGSAQGYGAWWGEGAQTCRDAAAWLSGHSPDCNAVLTPSDRVAGLVSKPCNCREGLAMKYAFRDKTLGTDADAQRIGEQIAATIEEQGKFVVPLDIAQLVESAYHWATGELEHGTLMSKQDVCDCGGDSLFEFIARETEPDGVEANSVEHAAQALSRMLQVQREIASVVEALSSLRIVLKDAPPGPNDTAYTWGEIAPTVLRLDPKAGP